MMTLILATLLTTPAPVTTAQVHPCVWPNTCSSVAAPVAQVQTCVWPNRCATVAAAQFQTCVWPHKCS